MKTPYKYISFDEKKKLYLFHLVIRENGKVVHQINKTAKTLEEILAIRGHFLKLQGYSKKMLAAVDIATSPKKEKVIVIPIFREGFIKWIDEVIIKNYKPSTLSTYKAVMSNIFPLIGDIRIDKISRLLIQEVISNLQERKNLSCGYTKKINIILFKYFKYEIVNGIILDNPCKDIVVAKTTQLRHTRAFTQQEKFKFLLTAKQEFGFLWYFIYYVYFQTGLRRGELAAIQWKDIDLAKGLLHVTKIVAFNRISGGEYISEPKTPQSKRIVPLRKNLVDVFKKIGIEKNPNDYVFTFESYKPKSKGGWMSINKITENFSKIRDIAQLDNDLTLHSTRKTFATELLLKGVDIPTVKALGGWSSAETLLNIYAHSNIDSMVKAIRG